MRAVFVAVVILVVAGSLAAGFYFLGPPAEQRARRMDERRTSDLERLRLAIDLYWSRNGHVPSSLDELAKESGTQIYSQDPETRDRYEYRMIEEPQDRGQKYQMCASFSRPSEAPYGFWAHPWGRQCFDVIARRIRP